MVPLIIGIICAGIYGLFELFVRRKERLAIIEKIGEKLDASAFEGKLRLPSYGTSRFSFSGLKVGCLMVGIGLGLLVAFIINAGFAGSGLYRDEWFRHDILASVYGASVLLFGGIGLLVAFIIEVKLAKKEDK